MSEIRRMLTSPVFWGGFFDTIELGFIPITWMGIALFVLFGDPIFFLQAILGSIGTVVTCRRLQTEAA